MVSYTVAPLQDLRHLVAIYVSLGLTMWVAEGRGVTAIPREKSALRRPKKDLLIVEMCSLVLTLIVTRPLYNHEGYNMM